MPLGKADRPGATPAVVQAQATAGPPATEAPEAPKRRPGRPRGSKTKARTAAVMAVREAFAIGDAVYARGVLFDANHRLVRRFPDYFEPVQVVSDTKRTRTTTATPEE